MVGFYQASSLHSEPGRPGWERLGRGRENFGSPNSHLDMVQCSSPWRCLPPIAEEVPGMSCPPSSFFTTLLRVIDRAWLEKVEGREKVAWPKREIGSKLSLREQCPGRGSL